jgi:hypothetical protein
MSYQKKKKNVKGITYTQQKPNFFLLSVRFFLKKKKKKKKNCQWRKEKALNYKIGEKLGLC